MTTFGILLHPDVEELDAIGPWEVFGASARIRLDAGEPADAVLGIATSLEPVRLGSGLRILPDHEFHQHPPLDIVLVPGGLGSFTEAANETTLAWLREVDLTTTWTTSVCSGVLLLLESGLAKGRNVATHREMEDLIADRGDCAVIRDQRWVVDGKIVSSQGISAGIDMALWLVGQLYGEGHARATQRYMQYEPDPPYQQAVA